LLALSPSRHLTERLRKIWNLPHPNTVRKHFKKAIDKELYKGQTLFLRNDILWHKISFPYTRLFLAPYGLRMMGVIL
jgi:hypothetical protein